MDTAESVATKSPMLYSLLESNTLRMNQLENTNLNVDGNAMKNNQTMIVVLPIESNFGYLSNNKLTSNLKEGFDTINYAHCVKQNPKLDNTLCKHDGEIILCQNNYQFDNDVSQFDKGILEKVNENSTLENVILDDKNSLNCGDILLINSLNLNHKGTTENLPTNTKKTHRKKLSKSLLKPTTSTEGISPVLFLARMPENQNIKTPLLNPLSNKATLPDKDPISLVVELNKEEKVLVGDAKICEVFDCNTYCKFNSLPENNKTESVLNVKAYSQTTSEESKFKFCVIDPTASKEHVSEILGIDEEEVNITSIANCPSNVLNELNQKSVDSDCVHEKLTDVCEEAILPHAIEDLNELTGKAIESGSILLQLSNSPDHGEPTDSPDHGESTDSPEETEHNHIGSITTIKPNKGNLHSDHLNSETSNSSQDNSEISQHNYETQSEFNPIIGKIWSLASSDCKKHEWLDKDEKSAQNSQYRCAYCDRYFSSQVILSQHVKEHSISSDDSADKDGQTISKTIFKLRSQLGTNIPTKSTSIPCKTNCLGPEAKIERNENCSGQLYCASCNQYFKNISTLKQHNKTKCLNIKKSINVCTLFNSRSNTPNGIISTTRRNPVAGSSQIQKPEISSEKPDRLRCRYCKLEFAEQKYLTRHENHKCIYAVYSSACSSKNFFCSLCKNYFTDKMSLKKHACVENTDSSNSLYSDVMMEDFFNEPTSPNSATTMLPEVKSNLQMVYEESSSNPTMRFQRKKQLLQHDKSDCLYAKMLYCPYCKLAFKDKNQLERHEKLYCVYVKRSVRKNRFMAAKPKFERTSDDIRNKRPLAEETKNIIGRNIQLCDQAMSNADKEVLKKLFCVKCKLYFKHTRLLTQHKKICLDLIKSKNKNRAITSSLRETKCFKLKKFQRLDSNSKITGLDSISDPDDAQSKLLVTVENNDFKLSNSPSFIVAGRRPGRPSKKAKLFEHLLPRKPGRPLKSEPDSTPTRVAEMVPEGRRRPGRPCKISKVKTNQTPIKVPETVNDGRRRPGRPFKTANAKPNPTLTTVPETVNDGRRRPGRPCKKSKSKHKTTLTNAPETTLTNAPETTLTNAPETTLTNAPETTLTNAPETTLTNAPETTPTNAPETTPTKAPETRLRKAPETRLRNAPETRLTNAPETTLSKAPEMLNVGRRKPGRPFKNSKGMPKPTLKKVVKTLNGGRRGPGRPRTVNKKPRPTSPVTVRKSNRNLKPRFAVELLDLSGKLISLCTEKEHSETTPSPKTTKKRSPKKEAIKPKRLKTEVSPSLTNGELEPVILDEYVLCDYGNVDSLIQAREKIEHFAIETPSMNPIFDTNLRDGSVLASNVPLRDDVHPRYRKPLMAGWAREIVFRAIVSKKNKPFDVYYKPPKPWDSKLRSRVGVEKYLEKRNIKNLNHEDFLFTCNKFCEISYPPWEIVLQAKKRTIRVPDASKVS